MQFKTFSMPASGNENIENELNLFLRSHKIVNVRTEFILKDEPLWCFLVEYVPALDSSDLSAKSLGKKIDYMKILTQEQFQIFSNLREKRKILAEEEKVPPYVIFTDEQLAEISKLHPKTLNELGAISGIGQQKLSKYGQIVLDLIKNQNEKSQ